MADRLPPVDERDSDEGHFGVEALVRQLVSQSLIRDSLDPDPASGRADRVLLDVEIDGVRCLLLRLPEAPAPLSPRELEIARMVAKGYPNKTIASVLDISSWTVASHLRRVFSKLGVSSRAAMVAQLLDNRSREGHPRATPSVKVSADNHPLRILPDPAFAAPPAKQRPIP
jgi:DNA-binding CsgD family transcriptional regulator